MYTYYLYFVERNLRQLRQLSIDRSFYSSVNLNYEWTKFLYIEISFDVGTIGTILNVSPNVMKLLGFQRCDLIGEPMSEIIPGFFRAQHEEIIRMAVAKGSMYETISQQVLVQSSNREFFEAKLQLSLSADTRQVSFKGSLQF